MSECKHGWLGNVCGKCGWTKELAMQEYYRKNDELEADKVYLKNIQGELVKERAELEAENKALREAAQAVVDANFERAALPRVLQGEIAALAALTKEAL